MQELMRLGHARGALKLREHDQDIVIELGFSAANNEAVGIISKHSGSWSIDSR